MEDLGRCNLRHDPSRYIDTSCNDVMRSAVATENEALELATIVVEINFSIRSGGHGASLNRIINKRLA